MASPSRRVPCAYTSSLQHHHMFSTSPHVLNIITSSQHHHVFDPSMFLRPSTFSTSIHLDLQQPSSISTFNLHPSRPSTFIHLDLQPSSILTFNLHPSRPSTFYPSSTSNSILLRPSTPTSTNFTFNQLHLQLQSTSPSTFFDLQLQPFSTFRTHTISVRWLDVTRFRKMRIFSWGLEGVHTQQSLASRVWCSISSSFGVEDRRSSQRAYQFSLSHGSFIACRRCGRTDALLQRAYRRFVVNAELIQFL